MKRVIQTKNAPAAIGTYSQAIQYGEFLYTSGQIGIDIQTGQLVKGGIEIETMRVLQNIEAILEAVNINKSHIIKLTVFLIDLSMFESINRAFEKFFDNLEFPARSTVEVSRLPMDARVEIECIAFL
tara:strand:- start:30 stop:410 length:381 start_codon:yes stop_codon:yes gene_type:complete